MSPKELRRSDEEEAVEVIFAAAYEVVTYHDSTDDDIGERRRTRPAPDHACNRRSTSRPTGSNAIKFHATLAKLWTLATRLVRGAINDEKKHALEALRGWTAKARDHFQGMLEFMDKSSTATSLPSRRAPTIRSSSSTIAGTRRSVSSASPSRRLDQTLALSAPPRGAAPIDIRGDKEGPAWARTFLRLERAPCSSRSPDGGPVAAPAFMKNFHAKAITIVHAAQGGHPRPILRAGIAQTILRGLVGNLPRRGLLAETLQLLRLASRIE